MSTANRSIKIVKREHRSVLAEKPDEPEYSIKTENQIRREILNTITSWIECQREGKRVMLAKLLAEKRETSLP
jgi:uncharacterized protein YebE (UPF0316 family)